MVIVMIWLFVCVIIENKPRVMKNVKNNDLPSDAWENRNSTDSYEILFEFCVPSSRD